MEVSAARGLIIDDCKPIRKIVRVVLQAFVQEIFEADSGVAGLRAWTMHRPDLIIVDFEMPRVNGATVTKVIRKHERDGDRRTAVLMVPAHGDMRHVKEA